MLMFYGLQEVNCIARQEGKNWNSQYFFYSRVLGFKLGTCCFTKIAFNHAHFLCEFLE